MKSDGKNRRGFTLMEVCVALVVLMIGGMACRYYVNTFLRLWERERLNAFMVETAGGDGSPLGFGWRLP